MKEITTILMTRLEAQGYTRQECEQMNVDSLVTTLQQASDTYYQTGISTLTDEQFDALRDLLAHLEPNHPFLKAVGAPENTNSTWPKVKHQILVGSQEKARDIKEFYEWFDSREETLNRN